MSTSSRRVPARDHGDVNMLIFLGVGVAVFAFCIFLILQTYSIIHDAQYGTFAILQKLEPYAPINFTRLVAEKLSSLTQVLYIVTLSTLLALVAGIAIGYILKKPKIIPIPVSQQQVAGRVLGRNVQIAPLPHVEELELIRNALPSGVIERLYPTLGKKVSGEA